MGINFPDSLLSTLEKRGMLCCKGHESPFTCSRCGPNEQTVRVLPDAASLDQENRAVLASTSGTFLCMEMMLKQYIGPKEGMMFSPASEPEAASLVAARIVNAMSPYIATSGVSGIFFDDRRPENLHGARRELANHRAESRNKLDVTFEIPDTMQPLTPETKINAFCYEYGSTESRRQFRMILAELMAKIMANNMQPGSNFVIIGSYGEVISTDESLKNIVDPAMHIEADTRIVAYVKHFTQTRPSTASPIVAVMNDNDGMAMTCIATKGPDVYFLCGTYKKVPMLNLSLYARRLVADGGDPSAHYAVDMLYLKSDYSPGIKDERGEAKKKGMSRHRTRHVITSPFKITDEHIFVDFAQLHAMLARSIGTHGSELVYEIMHRVCWCVLYYMCYNPDPEIWGWAPSGKYKTPGILPRALAYPGYSGGMNMLVKRPTGLQDRCVFVIE